MWDAMQFGITVNNFELTPKESANFNMHRLCLAAFTNF
jgi:hypothetical protein